MCLIKKHDVKGNNWEEKSDRLVNNILNLILFLVYLVSFIYSVFFSTELLTMSYSRFGVLVCIDSLRVHFNPMHLHCIDIIVLDNMLMHSATTYFAHINYLATILSVSIGSWERKSSIPRDISITLRLFMRLQHCSNEIKVPNSLVGVQWAWQITRQISHRHVHIRWSKTGEKANSKCFYLSDEKRA